MSDMQCTCCNGCVMRKTTDPTNNSFSKRLLVALSVIIIIAMCLTQTEARSVEFRRRHQRKQPDSMAILHFTKETSPLKRSNNPSVEQFKNATRKIKHKLRNTKRFFDQDRKVLNETREYSDGMPDWLPTVNFVDIHFHDYKSPRRSGKTISERKFAYVMPKLYKTLKEYEVIFKLLLNIEVDHTDDPFNRYVVIRRKLLKDTLDKLYSTIAEINENMIAVDLNVPPFDRSRMKLDALNKKVDATQCLKNDYIAFRGYGNLLNNWYSEFRCPLNKKLDRKCAAYNRKMAGKRENKRMKNGNDVSLS